MSKAPKANIARTWIVQDDIGEFTVGQKLTRMPHILAYLMLVYADNQKEELDLSSDEMVRIINETNIEGLPPDDAEQEIIDALSAHKHGTRGEDVETTISIEAALKRKHTAAGLGTKLATTKLFNEHLVGYLDADELIRKSCVFCMDDVAGRAYGTGDTSNWKGGAWSREAIEAMPIPGTKAPKGTVVDDSNRDQFDYYRYKTTNGVNVSSSWFMDAIIETPEGNRLNDLLNQYSIEKGEQEFKGDNLAKQIEIERKRLNKAAKFLRDGVTMALALWQIERLNGMIVYEVQRVDGEPARTPYPVRIWPKGNSGDSRSLTLSNCRKLLVVTKDAQGNATNAIDRTIANGGTMKALLEHGIPRKPRGQKAKVHISTALEMLNVQDAISNYVQTAGVENYKKLLLNKETGEANVATFMTFMNTMTPVSEDPDIQEVWNNYLTKERAAKRAKAERLAAMHNNKQKAS